MKLREIIKNTFEEEYKKEATHINALEKNILSQIKQEETSRSPFLWAYKMPYTFAAIILFLVIGTATVAATENPIKDTILQLTQRLQRSIENAQKNGEFRIDEHGQKVYTGKTEEEMRKLHKETRDKINELKSRPASERAKTIVYLQTWIEKYLYTNPYNPKQDYITYSTVVGLNSDPTHKIELYYSKDYEYQIDPETNKVYSVYIRGAREKGDSEKTYEDMTPRYNQSQLEQMAREFVKTQLPDVDLSILKLERGSKIGTYFFIWTGTEKIKRPTKDPNGFKTCGDVANPDSYDEKGNPCITQREVEIAPSIQANFTQGGQLLGFIREGF